MHLKGPDPSGYSHPRISSSPSLPPRLASHTPTGGSCSSPEFPPVVEGPSGPELRLRIVPSFQAMVSNPNPHSLVALSIQQPTNHSPRIKIQILLFLFPSIHSPIQLLGRFVTALYFGLFPVSSGTALLRVNRNRYLYLLLIRLEPAHQH
jgi:hypothetical protein